MMIIDPPSPFSSLKSWKSFRDEMAQIVRDHPESDEAKQWLAEAEDMVRELLN